MSLTPDFSTQPYAVYCGDALETVTRLAAGGTKVDCVVTSPPYFNQRQYGTDAHDPAIVSKEVGQEKEVVNFIAALVNVFKAIPYQPWANVWVNIGNKRGKKGELLGVPSRFTIAMQDAGFYHMDDVAWVKEVVPVNAHPIIISEEDEKNENNEEEFAKEFATLGHCMVEPAARRLNGNGWEPFYRFVLDPKKAWVDTCAVRIPRDPKHFFKEGTAEPVPQPPYNSVMTCLTSIVGRNCTNVWHVGTSRKGEDHFAAFPEELVERPVAMTCPEWVTAEGPRRRDIKQIVYFEGMGKSKRVFGQYSLVKDIHTPDESTLTDENRGILEKKRGKAGRMDFARHYIPKYPETTGWTLSNLPAEPGIVLDPFGGTGTTGKVALKLGRRFIGIDLYPDVADRMTKRCADTAATVRPSDISTASIQYVLSNDSLPGR
jgi:DNA modification methylase